MVRLLFAAGLLLAGLLYFLLSGRSDSGHEPGASERVTSPGQLGQADDLGAPSTEAFARPLRMRGEASTAESQALAAVPVKRIEASLSDAFASEAADGGAVGRERDAMIRTVVANLVDNQVGDGQIAALECRSQHCLVQFEGADSDALIKLLDALQDDRGFLGKCESMMLSREGDTISVYLRFPDAAPADVLPVTPTSPNR